MAIKIGIICPNCGDTRNQEGDIFCAVCYYPFNKMDGWGEIGKNRYSPRRPDPSKKLFGVIGCSFIFIFGLLFYIRIMDYYGASEARIESQTLNNIMHYKETVAKMDRLIKFSISEEYKDRPGELASMETDQLSREKEVVVKKTEQKNGVKLSSKIVSQEDEAKRVIFYETQQKAEPSPIAVDFMSVETPNFIIHSNNRRLQQKLSENIEYVYDGIIKDFGFFETLTNDKKLNVYIFNNADNYHKFSGLPQWSAGYASISQLSIYLYEGPHFDLVFPHELAHLVFGIFMGGDEYTNELRWINEGLAVYVEMKHNAGEYKGFERHMKNLIESSEFLNLRDVANLEIQNVLDENTIKTWYNEVGSLVKFLVQEKGSLSFYNFCNGLKIFDADIEKALNYAYSGEFNTIEELEKVWGKYLQQK
ncbi:MAG: hypothetical protein ABII27_09425 [bacterium]